MAQILDDLDFGGRLSLDDQISEALERIAPTWTTAVVATTRGAAAVITAAENLERGLSRTGGAITGWLRNAITDDRGRMRDSGGAFTSSFFQGAVGSAMRGSRALAGMLGARGSANFSLGGMFSSATGGARTLASSIAALAGQSGVLSTVLGGPVGIAAGLHGVIRGAMEAGGEIENLQLAFATLMHSSDAARGHLAELQQFAVGKPFEFSFLATQSRDLQTFGYTAQDALGMLRDFGDVAAGAGTGTRGFETFTRIAGQIRTMGRMTRGQVSQLGRAGLDVSLLRQQLGLTEAQFANIARAGIPADRLITALRASMRQQWGGGMERASQTLTAKLSDLDDVIGNLRRQLYEALGPSLIPIIDRVSGFLANNAKRLASAVSLVITTLISLETAVVAPVFGAMSDVMERANGRTRTSVGGVIHTLQRAALLIEGASALIVGDNGRGVSGISYVLREKLVRAGLWHTAVEIARFANRARAFLVGFAEATVARFTHAAARVRWLTDALGLTSGRMDTTRASAQALGARVAALVGMFFAARTALRVFSVAASVLTYLLSVIGAVTSAVRFLRVAMWAFGVSGGPVVWIVAAVAAVGLLAYYLSRNVSAVGLFRRAWESIRGVFMPVGALLARAWEAAKGLASEAGGALVSAFREVGAALRPLLDALAPLWRVLRVIGSFIVVALYVYVVALGVAFYAVARIVGFVLGAAIRGFLLSVRLLVSVVSALAGVWATVFRGLFALLAPVWSVLKVVGAFVGVVLYVAFLALGAVVRWVVVTMLRNFIATFVGIARAVVWLHMRLRGAFAALGHALMWVLRMAFGPLFPYLVAAFNAVASTIGAVFRFLAGHILDPFRMVALALVRVFQSLPAAMRPAALSGAISTLTEFGHGGAENPSTDAGVRGAINASRAAPARAANAASAAATSAAAAAANAPAPIYNPPPTHVSVQVDRREIARAVQEHQDDDAIRYGDTRGTTPRRPR